MRIRSLRPGIRATILVTVLMPVVVPVVVGAGSASAASAMNGASAVANVAAPAREVPAADREVSFVIDGTTTYGTLHVPAHRPGRRLPGALLIPGSGPTDRNGDQPAAGVTPHTLALLAGVLDTQGVASFRFDKYRTGRTGLGAYTGRLQDFDYQAQVRQAEAAYRALGAQPEVERHELMVFGHSEGALTAMLIAARGRPGPVRLALLAPLDERLLDLIRLQVGAQLDHAVAAGQLAASVAATNHSGMDRAVAAFRAHRPVDVTGLIPEVAALLRSLLQGTNARYVRSVDDIYPPAVAAALPAGLRTLVTCGTADTQVPCATTTPLVRALRQARTGGPGLVALPDVDHFLHRSGTPINTGTLAPAAVKAVTSVTAGLATQRS